MSEAKDTKAVYSRITWILILINIAVPALVLFQRRGGGLSDTAYVWVGWISATGLTAVLVAGTYFRLPVDRQQISRTMLLTSLALVVLSGLITTISIAVTPSDNYLEVALSETPLNDVKPERKRLMVELIRREKAASDENNRMAKSMKPISPALYSVASFANKAAMESASSQLKQAYEIDQAYAAAKLQMRRTFHDKMQRVDPGFLSGVESKMYEEDSSDALIQADEAKWVSSALSLYAYAAAHASDISANSGGHLTIASEDVKRSFAQQVQASTALQQTMMTDRTKAVKNQQSAQDAIGLKHPE